MTTFIETFSGRDDRAQVLSEILRRGPARPGRTLIAHVDRATQEVLRVSDIETPKPVLDADSCFEYALIHHLNEVLCAVAHELVPERTWTGSGWSAITGELITVVCREGAAEIASTETQFHWGWRYSNHLTAAFDGDVYVVTPQGWASMFGDWSGPAPKLPARAVALVRPLLVEEPAVEAAEKLLTDASLTLLGPEPGECLLCYVHRMLAEFGCDRRLRFATHYRDVRAPRATALADRLGRMGGFCDCGIFGKVCTLRRQYRVPEVADDGLISDTGWPDPLPSCRGVRGGSTQPCSLWLPHRLK